MKTQCYHRQLIFLSRYGEPKLNTHLERKHFEKKKNDKKVEWCLCGMRRHSYSAKGRSLTKVKAMKDTSAIELQSLRTHRVTLRPKKTNRNRNMSLQNND
jgi:hypothetical protein